MSDSNSPDIPELPGVIGLEYFAEGAANILYRIRASQEDVAKFCPFVIPSESRLPLLRLRKNLLHTFSPEHQYACQEKLIKPLLPTNAVLRSSLVRIRTELLEELNTSLVQAEKSEARPLKRHGTYLATDKPHGLLLEDMSSATDHASETYSPVTIELKPKWLAQSPSAPRWSIRCRTCALNVMRASDHASKPDTSPSPPEDADEIPRFCRLDLVSGKREAVGRVVDALLTPYSSSTPYGLPYGMREELLEYLIDSEILTRLKDLQMYLDPDGILAFDPPRSHGDDTPGSGEGVDSFQPVPDSFLVATTLRDCTLFIRITPPPLPLTDRGMIPIEALDMSDDAYDVEARLGDLDIKIPHPGKIEYWRSTERRLIDEDYYCGAENGRATPSGSFLPERTDQSLTCWIQRQPLSYFE